ncbi:hypothetical protein [Ralstonia sp.]|uniref:hypothetical protein n=1 Tax=Ralstonia sp. TaxID=54061 RepID=UPI0031CFEBEC
MDMIPLKNAVEFSFHIDVEGQDLQYTAHVHQGGVVFFRHMACEVDPNPFDVTTLRGHGLDRGIESLCRRALQQALEEDLFRRPALGKAYLARDTKEWDGYLKRVP